ncbi:MAG: hypothetical protein HXS40_10365, partial [Theionarchaea archaeon]|nr:hypothetical protein [Theionarchaea archaeon]
MKRILVLLILITGCIGQQQLQFQSCSPAEQTVVLGEGEEMEFSCLVTESQSASYTWYVNEEMVSEKSSFTFSEKPGTYTITLDVSMGRQTLSHEWDVTVEESSESLNFSIIESKVEAIRGLKFLEPVKR